MIMPSRRFLLSQAVLSATKLYEPETFKSLGILPALRCMVSTDFSFVRPDFEAIIRSCFNDLTAQYQDDAELAGAGGIK